MVVITPAQWEDMSTVAHGSFESALDRVKRTLLAMKPHEGFAVYADYGLEPSTTETLPESAYPNPEQVRGRRIADTGGATADEDGPDARRRSHRSDPAR